MKVIIYRIVNCKWFQFQKIRKSVIGHHTQGFHNSQVLRYKAGFYFGIQLALGIGCCNTSCR